MPTRRHTLDTTVQFAEKGGRLAAAAGRDLGGGHEGRGLRLRVPDPVRRGRGGPDAFDQDDPTHFTRRWFAWANTLFGELVLKVRAERPHLLGERL
jgi:Metal-independent alpha-mannosidase (GH125)